MIETQLSIFDAIVLGILVVSCLFAFFRGFVREILSLGAWIGAALVTLYYFPSVAEKLQSHFSSPVVAAGFATLGLYILALMFFSLINMFLFKYIKSGEEVGATDNILGLVFGGLRGAFIVSLGYFLVAMFLPEDDKPEWLERSITLPYVEQGAQWLAASAPDYMSDMAALGRKIHEESPAAGNNMQEEQTGYSRDSQAKLDRLLDSMEHNE